jgi:GTP-binding protein EngB required for normal cell division
LLLEYCEARQLAVHLILNKIDKLSNLQVIKTLNEAAKVLTAYSNSVTFQGFSALKNKGIEALRVQLDAWYEFNK